MLSWLDRLTLPWAPRWTVRRLRARVAADLLVRHYEAAAAGRRTQGWSRRATDGNAALGWGLARLREQARDLIRNNPWAESALATIQDHTVGWGIVPTPAGALAPRAGQVWREWAETTACDADGRLDFAGLQKQVVRTVAEAGEVLVRRRWRRPEDGLPVPLQLQVLEPDYLDHLKDGIVTPSGGRIIQGVEFNPIGQRVAYWLFPEHPGATGAGLIAGGVGTSRPIPASEILHVAKVGRPGQVRAASWFAPVMLRLKDFDDYEDAALMKQKIAACLAVITSDVDGTGPALGSTDPAKPEVDSLEPGMILNAAPGRTVTVVDPPRIAEHDAYTRTVLRGVASGLGLAYEDLTGDYQQLPFSAARMSRIRHWARVDDWRWRMLVPQFCDPVWAWVMQAAVIGSRLPDPTTQAVWTAPPMPMLEPDKEGLAYQRLVRSGLMSLSEALRELGYNPSDTLAELATDFTQLDRLGLILDSDPRQTTQNGQLQGKAAQKTSAPAPAPTPSAAAMAAAERAESLSARWREGFEAHARLLLEAGKGANGTGAAPAVTINAPVTVNPPDVTIEAPKAPDVHVDAGTRIEAGAVQTTAAPVTVTVTPPPPAGPRRRRARASKAVAAVVSGEAERLVPPARPAPA